MPIAIINAINDKANITLSVNNTFPEISIKSATRTRCMGREQSTLVMNNLNNLKKNAITLFYLDFSINFSVYRLIMAAASALVALSLGARVSFPFPIIIFSCTAQEIASFAQSETALLSE